MIEQLTGFDPIKLVATLVLAGATSYIIHFYYKVSRYPRGPLPLPLIGNILKFRGNPDSIHDIFSQLGGGTKGIFSLWFGPVPIIAITDPDHVIEAFHNQSVAFAGRNRKTVPDIMREVMFQGLDNTDVGFSDFNREWEVMRRIIHSAAMKYYRNRDLPKLISRVVDETVVEFLEQGIHTPYDPKSFMAKTTYNIICSIAFGKEYHLDDPEFIRLYRWAERKEKFENSGGNLFLGFAYLRVLFRSKIREFKSLWSEQISYMNEQFNHHKETFDPENIRDFTDAVLLAKSEEEDPEHLLYLHDKNMVNLVLDLFLAGSDTTKDTLTWVLFFMAQFPDYQQKIRYKIIELVGEDDQLDHTHRSQVPLLSAFIAETMRMSPVLPLGIFHQTTCDTIIDGVPLKKGYVVMASLYNCLNTTKGWNDPRTFDPNRFLTEDGNFINKPNRYYIPFSAGKRACPGEKLALVNLFLIVGRLLQKTNGFSIELEHGPGSIPLDGDPWKLKALLPRDYKLRLIPVNK